MNNKKRIYLTGKSYPVKDTLRELGCKWDLDKKAWYTTDENIAVKAQEIINRGESSTTSTSSRPKYTKCQVCGVAASRYQKIYASGECRDCYEERKMGY